MSNKDTLHQYYPYEVVNELCPKCGIEVELAVSFVIQKCPSCGKSIYPCSMCIPSKVECSKCPLKSGRRKRNS
jgi:predicted RNA-binding Zn-ribbon protein involved in translation (DUF1610 family)